MDYFDPLSIQRLVIGEVYLTSDAYVLLSSLRNRHHRVLLLPRRVSLLDPEE